MNSSKKPACACMTGPGAEEKTDQLERLMHDLNMDLDHILDAASVCLEVTEYMIGVMMYALLVTQTSRYSDRTLTTQQRCVQSCKNAEQRLDVILAHARQRATEAIAIAESNERGGKLHS